ncbi:hypothetical protein D9M71_94010 [compost metagenome]
MSSSNKEKPGNKPDIETSLLDSDAAKRALDYYLNPSREEHEEEEPLWFSAREDLTTAQAMLHTSSLLRCAAATAYESADSLQGPRRDLAFSVVHMINLARAMVTRTLNRQNV